MNPFAQALGQKFLDDKDAVRIRTFELGGHTFRVKVPLTLEFEAMMERIKQPDTALADQFYTELVDELKKAGQIVEEADNDVVVDGYSMREAAANKVVVQKRITEMFRLLVPEEKGFDMGTINYQMIDDLFPFPIQMQMVEAIGKVVSPGYQDTKGK